jgi:hypothetical protein
MDSLKKQVYPLLAPVSQADFEERQELMTKTGDMLKNMTENPDGAEKLAKTPEMLNTLVRMLQANPEDVEL